MSMIVRFFAISAVALTAALTGFAVTVPASAEIYANDPTPTDPNRAAIEALAKDVVALPAMFGCPEFAWGQMSAPPQGAALEFVPTGDDVKKWKRLFTVTTFGLNGTDAEQAAQLKELRASVLATFVRKSNIINSKLGTSNGAPVAFIEYELGNGADKEHAALGIVRLHDGLAGIVQIQSRGAPLPKADASKMEQYALHGITN